MSNIGCVARPIRRDGMVRYSSIKCELIPFYQMAFANSGLVELFKYELLSDIKGCFCLYYADKLELETHAKVLKLIGDCFNTVSLAYVHGFRECYVNTLFSTTYLEHFDKYEQLLSFLIDKPKDVLNCFDYPTGE